MNKIILTDIDGCVLDWDYSFNNYVYKTHGLIKNENCKDSYNIAERFGISFDFAELLVYEFNISDEIKNLPPFRDSCEYINKLADDGYRFIAITAVGDHPKSKLNREHNLRTYFGDNCFLYEQMVCVPMNHSKHYSLKGWSATNYFWIEDNFRHAESGHELGLQSLLMDNDYNSHYDTDLFPRVYNWKEIYRIVTEYDPGE